MRNLSVQGYAIALLIAAKVGGTMIVADRYGWHRDELYYLASSRHLSLGYVDYPPVTPLLARLDQAIFPGSLPGLRLLTVLAGAAVIVIAALTITAAPASTVNNRSPGSDQIGRAHV